MADPKSKAQENYLKVLDKRIATLEKLKKEATRNPAYKKEKTAVDSLLQDIDKGLTALKQEKDLREELVKASKESSDPNKDPVVQELLGKLKTHRSNNASYYVNNQQVGNPCMECDKKLSKLRDPDYPVWTSTTYGSGPYYPKTSKHTIDKFSGWNALIKDKIKTESEKNVIITMSKNEGELDQVQGYDDQVASLGVMQKTINKNGEGELPQQVEEFSKENPEKYKQLFEDKGWFVKRDQIQKQQIIKKKVRGKLVQEIKTTTIETKPRLYYKDPSDPSAKPMTGKELKDFIVQEDKPENWKKTFLPLKQAGQDPDFQKKQVIDYNKRLVNAVSQKPTGYDYSIQKYITSEQGTAMVLDQSVNRPAYVKDDVGKALNGFYKENPKVDRDPSKWTEQERTKYEEDILDRYIKTRRLVDGEKRSKAIQQTDLGSTAGSMIWP